MADPGMLSQVLGLVGQGMSPQEAKTALEQARLMEMARLTPAQQTYYGTAEAGGRLAGGLGRLLGGGQEEDAMLRKASDFASMRNQIDPTDSTSLAKAAQQFYKLGFTAQGDLYAKTARETKLKEAEITAKTEEKKTPEQKNAYDIVSNDPLIIAGSPQFKKNYVETLKGLTSKAITAQVDKVGVAESTREPVYFDKATNEQFTVKNGKRVAFSGGIDQTTAKNSTNLDIGSVFDKARAAGDAKAQSEAWGKAGDTYKTQVALSGKLDRVVADLPSTFTGSFANGSLQIAKVASGLGIPVDTKRISNTEYLNSVTSELVRTIARDFPGSQSNAELQQLLLSKPSSPQQWQTILRLLQDVQRQTKAGTITYEKLAKMPQEERFKVDYNLEHGQTQKKLARSEDLTARVKAGTASVDEAQELKKLRGELQ